MARMGILREGSGVMENGRAKHFFHNEMINNCSRTVATSLLAPPDRQITTCEYRGITYSIFDYAFWKQPALNCQNMENR